MLLGGQARQSLRERQRLGVELLEHTPMRLDRTIYHLRVRGRSLRLRLAAPDRSSGYASSLCGEGSRTKVLSRT